MLNQFGFTSIDTAECSLAKRSRFVRLVCQDYTTTFEDLLVKDNSLSFHHRNIHQIAIEMFKVKHDLSPPFIQELFSFKENDKGTRMGNTFERPNVDSVKKGDRSWRTFGPIVWNTMIPEKLKTCQTLDDFKNSIKLCRRGNCTSELCKTYIQGLE